MSAQRTTHNRLPFPLLATRFFIPDPPASCVSRPRLLERLNNGLQLPLILVCAPPGFGKSSLVSEWFHSQAGLHAAWLSLETSDQDWGLFFRYLIAAWQRIFPTCGETALAELNTSPEPDKDTLVISLLNDLLAAQTATGYDHVLLALDDYHRIESTAIHETIAYIVEHLPPRCHLVLLTRSNPPLPVARWRSHGKILELRVNDLRFTYAESSEYLEQTMRLDLTMEQVEVLQTRTEGWIVGLQMAALSLQGRSDTREFVRNFGGSNRFVIDYLVEEVVNRQPEDVQQFLLATAPMERFCSSLCDALLEASAPWSQHILERLEKANLFLIPLDDQRHWFRYHHLFADLVRVRLIQHDPQCLPALNRRAASWFAQNGLWREAILHAVQSGDFELSANLFEQAIHAGGRAFLWSGGIRTLIELFPAALVQARPLLSWAKAIGMIETSQLAGVEPLVRSAEQGILKAPPYEGQAETLGWIYVVQCNVASLLGDAAWIIEASRQVERWIPENTEANIDALFHVGNVYYFDGDLNQTAACWQRTLDLSQASGYTYGMLFILDNLGRICCHMGELQRAETLLERALQLSTEVQDRYQRWLGATQRDFSDLLREGNDLDKAREMMTAGLVLCEKCETVSGLGLGYIHMGRIRLAEGDLPGAYAMLHKAEDLRRTHTVYPDLETLVQVFHAQLLMTTGASDRALQVLETCLQSACCRHKLHREWVLIAKARVLVRTGHAAEALALLSRQLEDAHIKGRGRNWLEMTLLTALALRATGDQPQAWLTLREGLTFAQTHGFKRIFVDEGERMQVLLDEFRVLYPQTPLADFASDIGAIFPTLTTSASTRPGTASSLIEPLTGRELEILGLVCQGLSNSEIAARLVLSVGTVKTHIHTVYGKLGVRDRPQAIAKAGLLGLVH